MIYVFDVTGVQLAVEEKTLEEAQQRLTEALAEVKGTKERWFLGAYETWNGVQVAHPTAHDLPLLPGEFEVARDFDLLKQDAHEQQSLRFFRWPLTKAELQEHMKQFEECTGIYASGTPRTLTFENAAEEKAWLEQQR